MMETVGQAIQDLTYKIFHPALLCFERTHINLRPITGEKVYKDPKLMPPRLQRYFYQKINPIVFI